MYTYPVWMKNLTLSIDDDVLAAARRYAAEHDSTVNRIVRDFLGELAQRSDRAGKARKRLRQLSRTSKAQIGNANWTRSELHES